MKLYIRGALSIGELKTKFAPDMDDDIFDEILAIDPTAKPAGGKAGKYSPWIFKHYNEGDLGDQYRNLRDDLDLFSRQGKKFKNTDINQFKTVKEFMDNANEVRNQVPATAKEAKKKAKAVSKNGSNSDRKLLLTSDGWEVWQALTWAGNISLAYEGVKPGMPCSPDYPENMKATWCTAGESNDGRDYFNQYSSKGPIYVFIPISDPINKYQSCPADGSWWFDKNDDEYGQSAFMRFMSEHKEIGDFFEIVEENGVQLQAGNLVGFTEGAKKIIIPDECTSISKRFPSDVEEVYIPDSVEALGAYAFKGNEYLKKVRLPGGLKTLPKDMFNGCTALESIEIPNSVTVYKEGVFAGCTSLRSLKNSANLTEVGARCFADCKVLDDFTLPNSVSAIGLDCFQGAGFKSITLPDSLETLESVFRYDESIHDVDLNNVTTIRTNAFYQSSIANIDLSNVDYIGSNAFRGCPNLRTVDLKEDVILESHVFADSENLENITIPQGCQLGRRVMDDCPNLTVRWEADDMRYPFNNIKLLICDESCTELIDENKTWVDIQTLQGDFYPAEDDEEG